MVTSNRGGGKGAGTAAQPSASPTDLFKLPLEEFTAARNALATRLKRGGHAEEAERIRTLNKPPLSAWAVNQLFWQHRVAFDALLQAGEQFRTAQAAQLAGKKGDLRGTLEVRLDALSALSKLAARLLQDTGHAAGPDTGRRITTTLEALAAYGTASEGPRPGELTADVDPPGFEALAALVPRIGGSSERSGVPRVLAFRQTKRPIRNRKKTLSAEEARVEQHVARRAARAAAKVALRMAERTLLKAQSAAGRAEGALKKTAAVARAADEERAALESRLEKATAAASAARVDARQIASDAEEAAQTVTDAERAVEAARQALADLE